MLFASAAHAAVNPGENLISVIGRRAISPMGDEHKYALYLKKKSFEKCWLKPVQVVEKKQNVVVF